MAVIGGTCEDVGTIPITYYARSDLDPTLMVNPSCLHNLSTVIPILNVLTHMGPDISLGWNSTVIQLEIHFYT